MRGVLPTGDTNCEWTTKWFYFCSSFTNVPNSGQRYREGHKNSCARNKMEDFGSYVTTGTIPLSDSYQKKMILFHRHISVLGVGYKRAKLHRTRSSLRQFKIVYFVTNVCPSTSFFLTNLHKIWYKMYALTDKKICGSVFLYRNNPENHWAKFNVPSNL